MTAIGRSRKDYVCAKCGRVIKKGEISERYQSHTLYERRCKECSIAHSSTPDVLREYFETYERRWVHLQPCEETENES